MGTWIFGISLALVSVTPTGDLGSPTHFAFFFVIDPQAVSFKSLGFREVFMLSQLLKSPSKVMLFGFGLLIACSSGGGGGSEPVTRLLNPDDGKPLSNIQKSSFSNIITSLEAVDRAGRAAETGNNVGDVNIDEMKKRLRDNGCVVDIVNPGKPPTNQDFESTYRFNVSGATCPISQTATSTLFNKHMQKTTATHRVRYSVNDAAYSSLNDVVGINYDETMEAVFTFNTGGVSVTGGGKSSGVVKSQSVGDIKVEGESAVQISATNNNATGGIENYLRLNFSGYVVVLRMKQVFVNNELKPTYFLNGSEITREKYLFYTRYLTLTDAERNSTGARDLVSAILRL